MNSFKIFLFGIKTSFRKPGSAVATLMILVVPLMCPLFWLQAFWNPYGNIGNMPIAFVNEDGGAFGASLQSDLQASGDLTWTFVSDRASAETGLKMKDFYAVYIIPEDFSERISNTQTASFEVVTNSKNNFMGAMLAQQIEARIENGISYKVSVLTAQKAMSSEQMAEFIANPVDSIQTDLNPVENTGTGFAPYFSSLALWIGALFISLVIGRRADKSRIPDAKGTSLALGQFMLFSTAGIAQAALLTGVLYALGIDVQHGLLTFTALVVTSLCCIALVSTLIGIFGMLGQMLSMFVLIFQLTASGGTFPTELTQGSLFITLHPFVPFTYSVNALREAISGVPADSIIIAGALCVQIIVALVAVVLNTLVQTMRGIRQLESKRAVQNG